MASDNCTVLFTQHLSFWDQLTPAQQDFLCRSTREVHYAKGASVHRGDQQCVGVLLIKSGQLRTYMLSEEGRDVTLYRLFAGDVCILSASCVLDAITFDVCIDAEEDAGKQTEGVSPAGSNIGGGREADRRARPSSPGAGEGQTV